VTLISRTVALLLLAMSVSQLGGDYCGKPGYCAAPVPM
jgi:hypothetical protein